jgi:branched-chain amino acid aminotransferase
MSDCIGLRFIINGNEYPVSEYKDDFFKSGKVVYEVLRAEEGIPLFVDDYINRLQKTVQLAGIKVKADKSELLQDIKRLIKINDDRQGPIKLMMSEENLLLHYMRPYLPEPHEYQTGVKTTLLHEERANPNAKIWNTSFREKVISALHRNQAYEVILVNQKGEITEGGRSNVFFVKGNELYTAPSKSVLPGITRMKVLEICLKNSIKVYEKIIGVKDIQGFDAAFLTGTSRKVVPVKKTDNIEFSSDHPLVMKISRKFEEMVTDYIHCYLTEQ